MGRLGVERSKSSFGPPVKTVAGGEAVKMPAAAVILTISPGMKGATAIDHVDRGVMMGVEGKPSGAEKEDWKGGSDGGDQCAAET